MRVSKWKICREEYKGKNVLGEKIYKVWSIKTAESKEKRTGLTINVVIDHKVETILR